MLCARNSQSATRAQTLSGQWREYLATDTQTTELKGVRSMTALARFVGAASLLVATLCQAQSAPQPPDAAAAHSPVIARNVVLVHGAWADGSSWAAVIARLQAKGLPVTGCKTPRPPRAAPVAEPRRILARQNGPTVLVAHSWGGTVISD